jgi:hypothetical protein
VPPPAKAGSPDPCPGPKLDELPKARKCTHGPDPAPPGRDVRKDVPLVPGGSAAAPGVICSGDGVSGNRTQVLYVRSSDVPDRLQAVLPTLRVEVAEADQIYSDSAVETGGEAGHRIRFVHDAGCQATVTPVVISPTGDDTFDNTISEIQQLGYNRTDRKYLMFVDANMLCGIATIDSDDSPSAGNRNNVGPDYARNDAGCWDGWVLAHEHMHNLGGVQLTAPNTSGGFHCVDEYDVMCYSDTPNYPPMRIVCSDPTLDTTRFDCTDEDYYNANPPPGSYLDTHWNTYDNGFLLGPGGPPPCPDQALEPDDVVAQARLVAPPSTQPRAYCAAGDHDWVRVQATTGVRYRFATANLGAGVDTVLDLIDGDGTTVLATNDDSAGTDASLIDFTATKTGSLYIRSRHFDSTAGGQGLTYDLSITDVCTDAFEPDNTAAAAKTIMVGAPPARHAYCTAGDEDWVRFDAVAGTTYRIETSNLAPGTDTFLHLLASNGTTELASNDDSSGYESSITYQATAAGRLYVRSHHYNPDARGAALTYDLQITATAGVPGAPTGVVATAGNATASVSWTAPVSDGGASITGYTVRSAPGGLTASVAGAARSATVTGLTNGRSYTFAVTAVNSVGSGPASAVSNAVTPTAGGSTLINEAFGSSAANFTRVAGGTWAVSGGRYVLSAPADGGSAVANSNISVHNTVVAGDFTLTAAASTTPTSSRFNDFSVIFGFRDASNYYFASFAEGNDANTSGIFKVSGGTRTQLADISRLITAGTFYPIRVERQGAAIRVFRSGTLAATVNDSTFTSGRVGFGSRNDGGTFDDLLVTGTTTPAPAAAPAVPEPAKPAGIGEFFADLWAGVTSTLSQ